MGKSGALFDILKLNDISKTFMATLSAEEMYDFLKDWTDEFGTAAQKSYFADKEYLCKVLTGRPRRFGAQIEPFPFTRCPGVSRRAWIVI